MPPAAAASKAAHIAHHKGAGPSCAEIAHAHSGIPILRPPLLIPAAAVLELLHQAAIVHIVRLHGGSPLRVLQIGRASCRERVFITV